MVGRAALSEGFGKTKVLLHITSFPLPFHIVGRLLYKEKITPSAFPKIKNKKRKEKRCDETPPVEVPASLFLFVYSTTFFLLLALDFTRLATGRLMWWSGIQLSS